MLLFAFYMTGAFLPHSRVCCLVYLSSLTDIVAYSMLFLLYWLISDP